ncbi:Alpha/Beta hydrolase protein [Triangularia verruculosa]|uniref:Alpha/Beta hydrolase protein n=1 Tax=Triangularia verruculosa TaxID=2587418 RepID=A0AAN6XAS7_9PEZI|nr:Alpha/Beta hydrolase protein [Triangularia verruculosa]
MASSSSTMRLFTIVGCCFATLGRTHYLSGTSEHLSEGHIYEGESLVWTACPDDHAINDDQQLECSHLLVPMDQFNASNNGLSNEKHFNISINRLRGRNATANGNINIFLNPGGPGGSATSMVYGLGPQLHSIVGENFNLLGFDPRGVGSSTPSISDDYWASGLKYSEACKQAMGEHGEYINTPQTAAEMNSILNALGQRDMYYWGFSYGTLLGQTYATMYPERSKRIVVDGVVNQFQWYTSFTYPESTVDANNVFHGFLDECIKAGNKSCPLAQLAETKEELSEKLISSISALKEEPASVYVDSTLVGLVRFRDVWYNTVFRALYSPGRWSHLAATLAPLLRGNATAFFLEHMVSSGMGPSDSTSVGDYDEGDARILIRLNDGVSGPARSPATRAELIRVVLAATNNTMFGHKEWNGYCVKQSWAIPHTHSYVPTRGVRTAHPLLILSSTFDPVTPLISARLANDAFVGSRLVEVRGYGHLSSAAPSDCAVNHVRRYFQEGFLPENNVVCSPNLPLPYFPAFGGKSAGCGRVGPGSEDGGAVGAVDLFQASTRWTKTLVLQMPPHHHIKHHPHIKTQRNTAIFIAF